MTIKITLFCFLACAIIGCAKNRPVPLDITCDENIKTASTLLKNTDTKIDPDSLKKIRNLIQAAKIQQQHAEFASCIDKAQRALTLLRSNQE